MKSQDFYMLTKLRKLGDPRGIVIPKAFIAQLDLGEEVDVRIEDAQVVIRRAKRVREGWAEAAALIAAVGPSDEVSEWLDANLSVAADAEFVWE